MTVCGKLYNTIALCTEHCAGLLNGVMEMAVKHSEDPQWTRVPGCFAQTVCHPVQLCLQACSTEEAPSSVSFEFRLLKNLDILLCSPLPMEDWEAPGRVTHSQEPVNKGTDNPGAAFPRGLPCGPRGDWLLCLVLLSYHVSPRGPSQVSFSLCFLY